MNWVESNGGPLILIPERYLTAWQGADGPEGGETDYERACAISDLAGPITVGAGAGIVLGDEPLSTTWRTRDRIAGGMLVRRVLAPGEEAVIEALRVLPPGIPWEEVFEVDLEAGDGPLLLFDAALPGVELPESHLRITLAPGRYVVELSAYTPSAETALLLHRLRPTGG